MRPLRNFVRIQHAAECIHKLLVDVGVVNRTNLARRREAIALWHRGKLLQELQELRIRVDWGHREWINGESSQADSDWFSDVKLFRVGFVVVVKACS